ncbi:addiction module antitoxin, RelB/DinJ family [Treponema primitia ZAS-2]|uniref:Addiction module antitoxin, RelB/DinJ family n=1 Tax=Treponema primitia (strain ATCC BAA-887 / DSM 12427 / ZAS-2) TaxID=545694 RepID=F5YQ59_TREPZ|nr:type II toxin-antitoxin system RelB/DinJ family antitoxin [Treponema primitia]AEF84065.1 addiction module antitoxin, RelB/DinJ family [Treponema primitia ZAS-2]
MAHSSVIQVRLDTELKKDAESLFSDLGLDTPSAIRLFLKKAVAHNGIPFDVIRQDDFYNPHNMAHLKNVLADLNAGKGVQHNLIEDDE